MGYDNSYTVLDDSRIDHMNNRIRLIEPRFVPPLDPGFRPAVLANRAFQMDVAASRRGVPLVMALERDDGSVSRHETMAFVADHPRAQENLYYAERILKFLLWQHGGYRVYVAGPQGVAEGIRNFYAVDGERRFDASFMGKEVYLRSFEVASAALEDVPLANERELHLGHHLEGCRIGFDLGASDLKVSAVIDGTPVFSEEIIWQPRQQTDPKYHYQHIRDAIRLAASKMPRLDAIGGSAAGIYIDNRTRAASLFRGIPRSDYDQVRNMFLRLRDEFGVPLEVINDGEVTALAGAMALGDQPVLGVAMGSSEAAGYITSSGMVTNWLNELAFAPIDYNPEGPIDEWSGDRGVGSQYFSQQCVFRLANGAGIEVPGRVTDAEKLKYIQTKLEQGDRKARQIWESMGVYLGYGIAHYADFYELKYILVLGRCTSGQGGPIMLEKAQEVLRSEFPKLTEKVTLELPSEKIRRVGQSIAAASLPKLADDRL
jgi:predicted NBD/HSP70 family sugar kinase